MFTEENDQEGVNDKTEKIAADAWNKRCDTTPCWIPCSERLPEYGRYLVSCSWSIFSPMVMNYDPDDDEWFYDGCKSAGYEVPTINAWMPLPEPYREDGDT